MDLHAVARGGIIGFGCRKARRGGGCDEIRPIRACCGMNAVRAGELDQSVQFGDAMLDRLESADRLPERLARHRVIAGDFHQGFGAAGLFVRGDDGLQRQNLKRGGACCRTRRDHLGGRSSKAEVGDQAAVVKAVDRRSFDPGELDERGSIQGPCNDSAPVGTPIMHGESFVRGLGRFMLTAYVPTEERTSRKRPLLLTTGRILSQYNVGAQTRRTDNVHWHAEDRLEIHPSDAESRGIVDDDWVAVASRSGETTLRASVTERVQPGVVYTTFHHPVSGANVITTDNSDWATNCPEYKVTAVEVAKVMQPSEWQREYDEFTARQRAFLPAGNDTTPVTESDTSA